MKFSLKSNAPPLVMTATAPTSILIRTPTGAISVVVDESKTSFVTTRQNGEKITSDMPMTDFHVDIYHSAKRASVSDDEDTTTDEEDHEYGYYGYDYDGKKI